MIKFEIGKVYSSFLANELLLCSKRSKKKVSFIRESGVEYTVKLDVIGQAEMATVIPNLVFVSALLKG